MKHPPSRVAWTGLALALVGLSLRAPAPPPPDLVESHQLLPGTVLMWSGSLEQIPAGWRLCDGTHGTPDLRERFVLGVLPGGSPGELGGRNLGRLTTDNLPSHDHAITTSSNGLHDHFYLDHRASLVDLWSQGTYATVGAQPAVQMVPGETLASGGHAHTGEAFDAGFGQPFDNRPACVRLAFLMKDTSVDGQGVPTGGILAWSGPAADLPAGYALCDGTAGTPDLTDRFVQSTGPREQPGEAGGSSLLALGLDELPTHGHGFTTSTAGEHTHGLLDGFHTLALTTGLGGPMRVSMVQELAPSSLTSDPAEDHGHTVWAAPSGGSEPIDKRPAYASVAFAMYKGAAEPMPVPSGAIAMWTGALDRIPTGWSPCDGLDGRPDLQDRFLLGATEPGATGGSHQLTLTPDQLPTHDHDAYVFPSGMHDHPYIDIHGAGGFLPGGAASFHSQLARPVLVPEPMQAAIAGAHAHAATTDAVGLGAPLDNRPSFYRVLYLIKD